MKTLFHPYLVTLYAVILMTTIILLIIGIGNKKVLTEQIQRTETKDMVYTVKCTSKYDPMENSREKYVTFLISYTFKNHVVQTPDFNERIAKFREFFFHSNDMSENVSLKTAEDSYVPVLTNFEDYNYMNNTINLIAVFTSEENELFKSDTYDLQLEDDIFQSGTHHFKFSNS